MRSKLESLSGPVFVGSLCLLVAGCSAEGGDEGASGKQQEIEPVPAVEPGSDAADSVDVFAGQAIPGEVVVKFRSVGDHSVSQCAARCIRQGRSFSTATNDASASLDAIVEYFGVTRAEPLVSGRGGLSTEKARREYAARFARGAKVAAPVAPDVVNVFRLFVPDDVDVQALSLALSRDPHVEYAHPNFEVALNYVPNDPLLATSGSWGQAEEDLWGLSRIEARAAWDIARGDGVVVAVVDSGLDLSHPDISENVWTNPGEIPGNGIDDDENGFVDDVNGWDMASDDADPTDYYGHGTHVAGTIAAQDDNATGVVGVAPDALVMPVKGFGDDGSGSVFDLAAGLLYAAENGADVINNSWGCAGGCGPFPVVDDAITVAHDAGSVVVFAAGNDQNDVKNYAYLTQYEPISVAAFNPLDEPASFTNFGMLDLAAPGAGTPGASGVIEPERGILSLLAQNCAGPACPPELQVAGDYLRQAGTSMAAPHVSGVAALVRSQHPQYSVEQVRQVLRRAARDVGAAGFDLASGYGFLDALAALSEPTPLEAVIKTSGLQQNIEGLPLVGIAAGADFASYVLEYGQGTNPSSWTSIQSSASAVSEGTLGTWNVEDVGDGEYSVRLVATTSDGRTYEDRSYVVLDRVRINEPTAKTFLREGPLDIVGTVPSGDLEHFEVRIVRANDSGGEVIEDADVTLTGGGEVGVENDVIAVWDPTGLDPDHYRIELDVTFESGAMTSDVTQVVFDPAVKEGWPFALAFADGYIPLPEHAVLADVDGDGAEENVVAYGRHVNVYRADGSQVPGFPRSVGEAEYLLDSPVVGDVDGDGSVDIAVSTIFGLVHLWHADGTPHAGFPQQRPGRVDITLADVDDDGGLDMALADSVSGLDVVDAAGVSLPGFPVATGPGMSGAVTVADLDGDGDQEIAASLSGQGAYQVLAFAHDGTPLPGFPQTVNVTSVQGSFPVVGDVDDDGDLEIVVSAGVHGGPNGVVTAIHHDGATVAGWPVSLPVDVMSTPVLADLNGDGSLEVLVGANEKSRKGSLYVFDGAGQLMPGWPVFTPPSIISTSTPFYPPVVFDADGDDRGEIVVPRLNDFYEPALLEPYGRPLQAFEHDGTPIADLARPTYGGPPSGPFGFDSSPGVGDVDGDGLFEMVWFSDRGFSEGRIIAHAWDISTPSNAPTGWRMFRADARHSGLAQSVVPIVPLVEADRDVPRTVDGLARFRITTGPTGIIQIAHPWQANVEIAFDDGDFQSAPYGWGGSFSLEPHTTYLVRVRTPSAMSVRLSWW